MADNIYIQKLVNALKSGIKDVLPTGTNPGSSLSKAFPQAPTDPNYMNKMQNLGMAGMTAGKGYGKAPDWAMGFRKNGPQKGWDEQGYKFIQNVEVKWPDGTKMIDAQKGLNSKHALERARRNWEGAEITPLTAEEAIAKGGEAF